MFKVLVIQALLLSLLCVKQVESEWNSKMLELAAIIFMVDKWMEWKHQALAFVEVQVVF